VHGGYATRLYQNNLEIFQTRNFDQYTVLSVEHNKCSTQ